MSADDWCSVCSPTALKIDALTGKQGALTPVPLQRLSSRTTWQINQLRNETSTICRQEVVFSYLLTEPVIFEMFRVVADDFLSIIIHVNRPKISTLKANGAEPPDMDPGRHLSFFSKERLFSDCSRQCWRLFGLVVSSLTLSFLFLSAPQDCKARPELNGKYDAWMGFRV